MKVLVTGGAGFIGSHVVDKLLLDCNDVVVLDNLFSGNMRNIEHHLHESRFRFVKGDIRQALTVEKAIEVCQGIHKLDRNQSKFVADFPEELLSFRNVFVPFNALTFHPIDNA
jgi:UDP-glucose 4-epimerase